ncbi:hypothetical protein DSC91_004213 [Paraburkholderia caffeinilytica]|uniref:Uncharacterized protein n=1 Tax=Paraburkholderia caffeinilytica TaxID=1761016 RepID=A0ABQ1L6P4_9BURK|nr:hypothetical protein [Paraburkholderia caffeinilytica]AXL51521.1 hypothetical protein DSC91_004213 [Paraburkholderia caffeinilytica]GGC20420.1 hypothetical protein GCM10011400_03430 [Paraburkholderia caffeinilytica]CAB3778573.1 hypothetical protein LMG28690_00727 [Paraburkholderia caffeinilytica]
MKQQNNPLPERLAALELLVNDTGLVDELKARQRAEADKRRAALAAELKALPNRERELAALAKDAAHEHAALEKAATQYREAERRDKEATARAVIAALTDEGARQAILTKLERSAPPELADALDDLSFADGLLRNAVRTDETANRSWTGVQVKAVTSNIDAIGAARAQLAEAQGAIRELARDGLMPSEAMVTRCAEIVAAAMEPAFAFIPRKLWDLRHDKPASDIVAEVRGYVQ